MCMLCSTGDSSTVLSGPTTGLFANTTGAPVFYTSRFNDPAIDALDSGIRWDVTTASFSFYDAGVSTFSGYSSSFNTIINSAGELTEAQKTQVRSALDAWFRLIPVNLVEVADTPTSSGVIRIAGTTGMTTTSSGSTFLPNSYWSSGGDVWMNMNSYDSAGTTSLGRFATSTYRDGGFANYVVVHELGHALGLKHPFEGLSSNPSTLDPALDDRIHTVMSYTVLASSPSAVTYSYHPTTPMVLDIKAVQALYGANMSTAAGDNVYTYSDARGSEAFETIWDGGGRDLIRAQGSTAAVIDLRPGQGSTIGVPVYALDSYGRTVSQVKNVWIAEGAWIEEAQGASGNDVLIGNELDNRFYASLGRDSIFGGLGRDELSIGSSRSQVTVEVTGVVDGVPGLRVKPISTSATWSIDLDSVEALSFTDGEVDISLNTSLQFADLPDDLYQFFVLAFGAAPGAVYAGQIADAYQLGLSTVEIVRAYLDKPLFLDRYPTSLTAQQFGQGLINEVVGNTATTAAKALATSQIVEALNFGLDRAEVVTNVFGNLADLPYSDSTWGRTAQLFDNQVEVARLYSEQMVSDTVDYGTLQAVIGQVSASVSLVGQPLEALETAINGLLRA